MAVWPLRALLAVALAALFLGTADTPLFDLDEGAFSEATREMFERGDFIATYLNGVPRYDKPILIYWLQAASTHFFGIGEFAFRLPSVLCAIAWTLITYAFAKRIKDDETALIAAIMTATTLAVTVIGRAAIADSLLNLLIVSSMFAYWLWVQEGRRRWLYGTYAAMGLGFLAKGPIAVLIPGTVGLLFHAIGGKPGFRDRLRSWLRFWLDWRGILLFLLIAAPWYVAVYLQEGNDFLRGFFIKHNLGRFEGAMEGHRGGFFFYVPVALIGLLPFTTGLFAVASRVRTLWEDALSRYLLLWFAFVFVFFSFAATKLPHYLIYGQTGVAILIAIAIRDAKQRMLWLLPAILQFAILLFLPALLAAAAPSTPELFRLLLGDVHSRFPALYQAYFAAGLLICMALPIVRRVPLGLALSICGVAVSLGIGALLLPVAGNLQQEPIKEAGLRARVLAEPVVMWGTNTPSFSVYARRVTERRRPLPGETALTTFKQLPKLPPYDVLYAERGYYLVRLRP
jgi:4-amino-4-deoxy-L-arabinose transferase-like glycosyltransferase